jgi:hypothetical protein
MNSELRTLGETRMQEAINAGEDLAELLQSLCNNRQTHPDLFSGAVAILVACYQSARTAGMEVTSCDPTMASFMSRSMSSMVVELMFSLKSADGDLQGRQLSELVSSVNQLRSRGVRWDPAKPVVQPVEPLAVRVVSMPDRVTTTEVRRDGKTSQIIGSTQTEADAR